MCKALHATKLINQATLRAVRVNAPLHVMDGAINAPLSKAGAHNLLKQRYVRLAGEATHRLG
jgi:hypothetical protein